MFRFAACFFICLQYEGSTIHDCELAIADTYHFPHDLFMSKYVSYLQFNNTNKVKNESCVILSTSFILKSHEQFL
jgi:hypothetical protein